MKFSMMKNKKTTTHLVSKGFTILELLMVMLMITLLIAMVLVGFSRAKKNVNDDELLANLDLVRLGLEQYHSQCKVYPDQLDRTANNGYPGSPLCPVTLNDFLVPTLDLSPFTYQALGPTGANSGYCSAYHISVQLEERILNQGNLANDHDWTGSPDLDACSGGSTINSNDTDGYYDIKHP